ncbi:unnamed protein product [Phaeothamnion confervicola]
MNSLRLKAAMRNPDEFYFAMNKTKTKEGVHTIVADPALKDDVVRLLKTQDVAYVNMKRAADEKKVERMKETLHGITETPRNKHTIFVDSEKKAASFDPAEHFDTVPALAYRAFNRPRRATLETAAVTGAATRQELKKVFKKRDSAYRAATERIERAAKLRKAMEHLQAQRTVMNSKGTKKKVKKAANGQPAVFKWKRERAK